MELLRRGIPTLIVTSTPFVALVETNAKGLGWQVGIIEIDHPLSGISEEEFDRRAQSVVSAFTERIAAGGEPSSSSEFEVPRLLPAPVDPWMFYDFIQRRGWGDGLPLLPPTPDRVDRMLAGSNVDPAEVVGISAPAMLEVTARDVAANAVMAGCPDAAFPVVRAALRAAMGGTFNLLAVMTTTHPATLTTIVSGRVAEELGMNSGASAFGPDNRMNATIGRAVRLSAKNLGRAWVGSVDKASQGSPAKYTFCFAERLDAVGWPPYHVDRGFSEDTSTVTVAATEGPHNINDSSSSSASAVLQMLVGAMTHSGHLNIKHLGDIFLVLGPEHARILEREGVTRDEVRHQLFDRARVPGTALGIEQFHHVLDRWPVPPSDRDFENDSITIVERPEDINVLVVGADGRHSSWLPSFSQYSVIEEI